MRAMREMVSLSSALSASVLRRPLLRSCLVTSLVVGLPLLRNTSRTAASMGRMEDGPPPPPPPSLLTPLSVLIVLNGRPWSSSDLDRFAPMAAGAAATGSGLTADFASPPPTPPSPPPPPPDAAAAAAAATVDAALRSDAAAFATAASAAHFCAAAAATAASVAAVAFCACTLLRCARRKGCSSSWSGSTNSSSSSLSSLTCPAPRVARLASLPPSPALSVPFSCRPSSRRTLRPASSSSESSSASSSLSCVARGGGGGGGSSSSRSSPSPAPSSSLAPSSCSQSSPSALEIPRAPGASSGASPAAVLASFSSSSFTPPRVPFFFFRFES
mmetsp:Transcript_29645/g.74067  ORF Transcript_29645/g.74067 Transcript_29645/m.74067 type:complete len:330 (-) Transcript_29645:1011-2000(-)